MHAEAVNGVGASSRTQMLSAEMRCVPRAPQAAPYKAWLRTLRGEPMRPFPVVRGYSKVPYLRQFRILKTAPQAL